MAYNYFLKRLGNRLGQYDNLPPKEKKILPISSTNTIDGVLSLNNRLAANGGSTQFDRMVFDKRRSLDKALKYSYQSVVIRKLSCEGVIEHNTIYPNIQELDTHDTCRALINPDKLKMDYDDKILSVHYEEDFHAGDVFEWVGTNSYWLVYLQDLDERAYFRSEIRRCSYEIKWEDDDGEHSTYAAVRGPVETKINYIQKHSISVDTPNYSLSIYLPRNKETMAYFKRYSKFYLSGQDEGSPQVCWRVEAIDWISTPGILEINAVEYYANESEDDIENGIVGALIVDPVNPNSEETEIYISGETFIKPQTIQDYYFNGLDTSTWSLKDDKVPVKMGVDPDNPLHIRVKWYDSFSGSFIIKYGDYEKTIVVESLF